MSLHDLVVGADGHGWEVDVPDGVGGALDGGDGGTTNPLVVDRLDQDTAEHKASQAEQEPQQPETKKASSF